MDNEVRFWSHAEPFLEREGVTRGTMMGFPCLRVDGAFFASFDRKSGDLIVKVSAERVNELVASGAGADFAPAGKRFKEWVSVAPAYEMRWHEFLEEASEFVGSAD